MSDIITRIRIWLVAVALAFAASPLFADARTSSGQTRTTATSHTTTSETAESAPAGSPEFGILIIIAVVAFLIFIAWLVVRVGDDNTTGADRTTV